MLLFKILCPKCNAKIGSYSWSGQKCSCLTWVAPAFHIYESKVDLCKNNNSLSQYLPSVRQALIIKEDDANDEDEEADDDDEIIEEADSCEMKKMVNLV